MNGITPSTITPLQMLKLLWLLCFVALALGPDTLLGPIAQTDSKEILRIAAGEFEGEATKSYANTGRFFALLGPLTLPFILGLGLTTVSLFIVPLRTYGVLGMAAFLSFPAILMGMIRPQKELIVALVVLCSYLVARKPGLSLPLKAIIITAIYGIYAALFRDYYFIIAAAFLGTLIFIHVNVGIRLVLVLLFILLLFLLPDYVFMETQGMRDKVNMYRELGAPGHRSFFNNPLPANSLGNFLYNYAYAFLRLNIPVVFEAGPKEFFLLLNTILYSVIAFFGFKARTVEGKLLTSLFLGHILTLVIFEPDLGSYLRHTSSVFLYLVPGLIMLDRQWSKIHIHHSTYE